MKWILTILIFTAGNTSFSQTSNIDSFSEERQAMVHLQLEKREIVDRRVLDTFLKVKRHYYVPTEYIFSSYNDISIPIIHERMMYPAYISALMISRAEIKNGDRCLDIGTGSGYHAALLSELCTEVFSVERSSELAKKAQQLFLRNDKKNIILKLGDPRKGWEEHAPYDVIISSTTPFKIPIELIRQLSQGGRLITPVGDRNVLELIKIQQKNGELSYETINPIYLYSEYYDLFVNKNIKTE